MNPNSEPTRVYRFEIFRYDASLDQRPRFQTYDLAAEGDFSVLEALLKIQEEQDPSLAFRYCCRGAVCGSCAMSINGRLDLACRVQRKALSGERVVLEPLPGFEVLKDLVVDMAPFWERYERVRPWLHAEISAAKESRMTDKERQRVDQYVNCILCGLCHAACPVTQLNERFTGPAALAKLYRFLADSRERRDDQTLKQEDASDGVWGCRTVMRCVEVCPKNVRPADGIRAVRRKLLGQKIRALLRRKAE